MAGLAPYLRWIHLVAAAIWLGGMITLAVLVAALRRAGTDRAVIVAAARAFARLSWPALAVAILTGLAQVYVLVIPWSYPALQIKIALVAVTAVVALGHVRFAKALGCRPRKSCRGGTDRSHRPGAGRGRQHRGGLHPLPLHLARLTRLAAL